MKTLNYFLFGFIAIFALSSCLKTPEASIVADKTTAAVNETITVTRNSKNTNSYLWSVWEGTNTSGASTSRLEVVSGGGFCDNKFSFKLDSVGVYTVLLRAKNDKKGCEPAESSAKTDEASLTLTIQ